MLTLGEQVQPLQWAGIALVVSALACVMLGDRLFKTTSKPVN
jgi:O-acetylserine/cysteine efflux transporter